MGCIDLVCIAFSARDHQHIRTRTFVSVVRLAIFQFMVKLLNIYLGCLWQKSDFEKMSATSYHCGDPCSQPISPPNTTVVPSLIGSQGGGSLVCDQLRTHEMADKALCCMHSVKTSYCISVHA